MPVERVEVAQYRIPRAEYGSKDLNQSPGHRQDERHADRDGNTHCFRADRPIRTPKPTGTATKTLTAGR